MLKKKKTKIKEGERHIDFPGKEDSQWHS